MLQFLYRVNVFKSIWHVRVILTNQIILYKNFSYESVWENDKPATTTATYRPKY